MTVSTTKAAPVHAGRVADVPDPEVPARASRRRFSAEYKLRILEEHDRLTEPGAKGALLRREGLYSSHLVAWRNARDAGAMAGLDRHTRAGNRRTRAPRRTSGCAAARSAPRRSSRRPGW